MKNNTERDAIIYQLWDSGITFDKIAGMKIQSFLSLKRVRNIVYAGNKQLKSDTEHRIYRMFRLKFLELQDVNEAIAFTHINQPSRTLTERQIRNIINNQLKKRRKAI